ncbi:MAG TPA: hypothetical protein ACFYD0_01290 [Candidatus Wunengus sp. YC65]|uniref:hypothetical protein n=1 Tax=Candidatus Wunengus sp. YC65 TaxID=3367701 RepID=UPI004027DA31
MTGKNVTPHLSHGTFIPLAPIPSTIQVEDRCGRHYAGDKPPVLRILFCVDYKEFARAILGQEMELIQYGGDLQSLRIYQECSVYLTFITKF